MAWEMQESPTGQSEAIRRERGVWTLYDRVVDEEGGKYFAELIGLGAQCASDNVYDARLLSMAAGIEMK